MTPLRQALGAAYPTHHMDPDTGAIIPFAQDLVTLVEALAARKWQVFAATAESAFDSWPGATWAVSGGEVRRTA